MVNVSFTQYLRISLPCDSWLLLNSRRSRPCTCLVTRWCVFDGQAKLEEKAKEGWEYSRLFSTKFHSLEQKIDLVRRRRWHRKLVASGAASAPVFFFQDKDEVCCELFTTVFFWNTNWNRKLFALSKFGSSDGETSIYITCVNASFFSFSAFLLAGGCSPPSHATDVHELQRYE